MKEGVFCPHCKRLVRVIEVLVTVIRQSRYVVFDENTEKLLANENIGEPKTEVRKFYECLSCCHLICSSEEELINKFLREPLG